MQVLIFFCFWFSCVICFLDYINGHMLHQVTEKNEQPHNLYQVIKRKPDYRARRKKVKKLIDEIQTKLVSILLEVSVVTWGIEYMQVENVMTSYPGGF